MIDFNNKRELAVFGAYLSMLAYLSETKQRKYIDKHIKNYTLAQDSHKSLQYFVLKDHDNKKTYISIRGTDTSNFKESIRDLKVSLNLLPKKVYGHKVHRGYAKAGDALLRSLMPHIVDNYGYELIFVGHSLGGVLARYCGIVSGKVCKILTYGSPKLAERGFYADLSGVDITCYVNIDDIIPQFSVLYDDCRAQNHFILDDDKKYKYMGMVRGYLLPLLGIIRNTILGNVVVGLKAHSIKNYIRHLTKLSKLK